MLAGGHEGVGARLAELEADRLGAPDLEELAVVLTHIRLDSVEDVSQEWAEYVSRVVLFDHPLELDQRFLGIAARVRRDQLQLVGLVPHLEAAGAVYFVDRPCSRPGAPS